MKNTVFQKQAPQLCQLLSEISQTAVEVDSDLSSHVREDLDMLLQIGLLEESLIHEPVDVSENELNRNIETIKKDFVELLKKDLHSHDKFWDVLLNLESVDDKDGLIWFMSKVIEMNQLSNTDAYKKLFTELMELKNEK